MRILRLAGRAYNHCIALHYRYWSLYHRTIHLYALQRHLTKLKRTRRFAWLRELGSQTLQDITQRIDRAYRLFWQHKEQGFYGVPPRAKDIEQYRSFTLKQSGWQLDEAHHAVRIFGQKYRYYQSRRIEGRIQNIIVKREENGDFFVSFICRL